MDLTVLNQVSYGMYVVGAMDGDRPCGCIINTFCQITSENPIISISISKQNYTYEMIERTKRFSISILSEETSPEVFSVFGFASSRDRDKFDGFAYKLDDGLPVLTKDVSGTLLCDVLSMQDLETHVVVFARLVATSHGDNTAPMTYSYYHRVIRGKAPKNAPTYQAETPKEDGGERYVCDICGYVYEGDISKEPDDYVCPVCKQGKSHFKRA